VHEALKCRSASCGSLQPACGTYWQRREEHYAGDSGPGETPPLPNTHIHPHRSEERKAARSGFGGAGGRPLHAAQSWRSRGAQGARQHCLPGPHGRRAGASAAARSVDDWVGAMGATSLGPHGVVPPDAIPSLELDVPLELVWLQRVWPLPLELVQSWSRGCKFPQP